MEEVTEVLRKCSRMVLTGNKKKPQVTKSGPDLSRKLLYLYNAVTEECKYSTGVA